MILSNPIEKRNIIGYVSAIDSLVTILEAGYESARNTRIRYDLLLIRIGYWKSER